MIGIASIALVVGGIVIMNIMLVSVAERTGEIGLRKALGACRRDIPWQFLIEAVILCILGGALGIGFGSVVALIVKNVSPFPAQVSLGPVVAAIIVSSSVGLFFGIYPARKAARQDPILTLHYCPMQCIPGRVSLLNNTCKKLVQLRICAR